MIPKYNPRVDGNQKEIVQGLKKAGASVQSLSKVGDGCPDLIVGFKLKTFLMEVKVGTAKLTDRQFKWWQDWAGAVPIIVRNLSEALYCIGHVGTDYGVNKKEEDDGTK